MTGILDVAKAAGVSPATVSRALRGLPGVSETTREAVQAAAELLGYVASPTAAALPTGLTRTVGVLAPWVTRWFFTAVIEGANQVFARSGYDVLLFAADPDHDLPKAKLHTLSKRVDGLLILNLPWVSEALSGLASAERLQVVLVGSGPPDLPIVRIDDVRVGRCAAEHLISLGHRRIGFVGGEPEDVPHLPVAADRRAGCRAALQAAELDLMPRDVFPGDFTMASGEDAANWLLGMPDRPSAVVAASDELAMGLVHRLRQAGLQVPGDLSVVGVDGHDMAHLFGLTTVEQPVREQGRRAAEILLARMAGDPVGSQEFPTRLVVRETTAPMRRAVSSLP